MSLRELWAKLAVFAIGRKNPPTMYELKEKAWGEIPRAYKQTYGKKPRSFRDWIAVHGRRAS